MNTVCDTLQIPYIVNTGYMSNVVPLPEFYYPNNRYNFNYKHQFSDEKLLFSQVLSKADYMVAIQSSFVMLMQIKILYLMKNLFIMVIGDTIIL